MVANQSVGLYGRLEVGTRTGEPAQAIVGLSDHETITELRRQGVAHFAQNESLHDDSLVHVQFWNNGGQMAVLYRDCIQIVIVTGFAHEHLIATAIQWDTIHRYGNGVLPRLPIYSANTHMLLLLNGGRHTHAEPTVGRNQLDNFLAFVAGNLNGTLLCVVLVSIYRVEVFTFIEFHRALAFG